MSKHWAVYFDTTKENVSSILLDMDIGKEVNTEQYPFATVLRIQLKACNENGLAISPEAEALNNIEEELIDFLEAHGILHVGRLATNGIRDFVFYASKNEEQHYIDSVKRFLTPQGYESELFEVKEEENWSIYFNVLYPNVYQQQHIRNVAVIESLLLHEDVVETPRKVHHFFYFKKEKNRKQFMKTIVKEGFVSEEVPDRPSEDNQYVLAISRVDAVTYESINRITDLFINLTIFFQGQYEGWETYVVRKKP